MIRRRTLLSTAVGASLLALGASATAQYAPTYAVVEERGTYYVPETVYYVPPGEVVYQPPIVVERRVLTEDEMITEDVKTALDLDARLDSSRIAVETTRNSVALSGLVSTPGQARIARRDAQQVPGVSDVRNYIRSRVGDSSSN